MATFLAGTWPAHHPEVYGQLPPYAQLSYGLKVGPNGRVYSQATLDAFKALTDAGGNPTQVWTGLVNARNARAMRLQQMQYDLWLERAQQLNAQDRLVGVCCGGPQGSICNMHRKCVQGQLQHAPPVLVLLPGAWRAREGKREGSRLANHA